MSTETHPIDDSNNFAKGINQSLLANINHALRTPLNGMIGMMALLEKSGLTDAQSKYSRVLHDSTQNLMLQLDNIMELAKIDEGDLGETEAQITEAGQAISEFENRLNNLSAQARDSALKELEEVQTQIAQNKEILNKLENRVDRQNVRAPVRGLVKGLRVNTVGGVIAAGEPIMEIVPLDQTLIVEARIPPREIGNLTVGQPARVKVSAFDFSRYGVIEGNLEFLSATTFIDEQANSYYKGRIALNKNHVGPHTNKNLILPGMTVEADIITGKKTILAYLLKPIHTSINSALQER